ncbi:MAG: hypothetical protein LUC21_01580 [Oscillospiraceae bacterium]|nr:hypothetical protein [Oscillospiraceae bacterium]
MEICKAGRALTGERAAADDMALIAHYARGTMTPEAVYTFPVLLCDNEIDRDFERFDEETLQELSALFAGKTGISDHEWRSGNQVARIYKTELLRQPEKRTLAGDGYVALKAWAYMLRSEANAPLIADIEGGIRKEVSVGCSVRARICSSRGRPVGQDGGAHVPGQVYDGALCYATLCGAADAYEWSFVAVPSQRGAGVTKAKAREETEAATGAGASGLCDLVKRAADSGCFAELCTLQKEAALGREYLAALRAEVKRLGLICGREIYDVLAPETERMEAGRLLELKDALERQAAKKLPLTVQLPGARETVRFDGDAYRV